jgi:prepilin-type processing-associated H-X9-DG protein
MNSWFYSHSRLYDEYWSLVNNGYPASGSRTSIDFTKQGENSGVPSRMALFIEMEDAEDSSSSGREGQSGEGKQKARLLKGDCVWEWSDVVGLEKGRYNFKKKNEGHFKGGTKYCNVVFVDGHVMAVPEVAEEPAEWNDHQDIEDVFKSLGKGSY